MEFVTLGESVVVHLIFGVMYFSNFDRKFASFDFELSLLILVKNGK